MQTANRMSRVRVSLVRSLELYISYCLALEAEGGEHAESWRREAVFAEAVKLRINTKMQAMVIDRAGGEVEGIEHGGSVSATTVTTVSPQQAQLQAALLSAFNEAGLRQVVRFELGTDLDQVAGGEDTEERAFNLVQWAARTGRMAALLAGALKQNPTNPELRKLAGGAGGG